MNNNVKADFNEFDCFLCQEEYSKHLEKHHGNIFGLIEFKNSGGKYIRFPPNTEPNHLKVESYTEIIFKGFWSWMKRREVIVFFNLYLKNIFVKRVCILTVGELLFLTRLYLSHTYKM